MSESQTVSPRRRMQELLAIPDSKRTDAEWDELNELEISLAPVNQISTPEKRAQQGAANGVAAEGRNARGARRKASTRSPRRSAKAASPAPSNP